MSSGRKNKSTEKTPLLQQQDDTEPSRERTLTEILHYFDNLKLSDLVAAREIEEKFRSIGIIGGDNFPIARLHKLIKRQLVEERSSKTKLTLFSCRNKTEDSASDPDQEPDSPPRNIANIGFASSKK